MVLKWEQRAAADGYRFLDAHYIHEEIEELQYATATLVPELPSYHMDPTTVLGVLERLRSRAEFFA